MHKNRAGSAGRQSRPANALRFLRDEIIPHKGRFVK
nr:MAG TPA: hypothetical protein [Caudoviricetes sp.]